MSRPRAALPQFLIPELQGWSIWELAPTGPAVHIGHVESPTHVPLHPGSILAYPVRRIFSVPLWLATEDESLADALVTAQIERRGLLNRTREETTLTWRILAREEGRLLISAFVVPRSLDPALHNTTAEIFDVSARLFPLRPDHMTLWREDGRIVVAFTRADQLVHCQALSDDELSDAAVQELLCCYLDLAAQRIVNAVAGLIVWGPFRDDEMERLRDAFRCPPGAEPKPPPLRPAELSDLIPEAVAEAQAAQETAEKTKSVLLTAGAVYGLILLMWIAQIGYFSWRSHLVRQQILAITPTVESVKQTYGRWIDLQSAINPDRYPVELLFQIHQTMPSNVFLTSYQIENDSVLMVGEANSAVPIFDFKGKLTGNQGGLTNFTWNVSTPKPLANNVFQFNLTGNPN